ncbi:hypothetical protein ACJMK2_004479, partial [Sinanodonta woodiana]
MLIKMNSTFVIVIILCMSMSVTEGLECKYRFGRCFDTNGKSGTCSALNGICSHVPGTDSCRCINDRNKLQRL